MPITPEAAALQAQLDADLDAVTDAQERLLIAAWVAAWAEVSTDLDDTIADLLADGARITRALMARSSRLRQALILIQDRLETLAARAGVIITADLDAVVTRAARAQADIIRAELPDTPEASDLVRPLLPDRTALDAIVERTTEQITAATRPLPEQTMAVIRRELVRGIADGENPRATARRIVDRAQTAFDGGLARALNIARTEMLDAHRDAAEHGQSQHTEVLAGWVWLCHLDTRTCPSCIAKHGTLHELDEAGPHDHHQGRCARMPKTKTWRELGIDIDEPADDATAVPDARAWFDQLPEADQLRILGARRLKLLRDGVITWDDLTVRRTTPGWRDSWHPTPVRDLERQASRGRRAS